MKWLRTGQVAARLGWSSETVRELCEQEDGKHFRNAKVDEGGQWRIPESDVEAYERFRDALTAAKRGSETKNRPPKPPELPKPPEHSE